MERRDANPILFYLKQSIQSGQLDHLLKREIDARQFFLLCDSKAAQKSPYVQKEFKYVQSWPNKRVQMLDVSWPWIRKVEAVKRLIKSGTVFISYSRGDMRRVKKYVTALQKLDMKLSSYSLMAADENIENWLQKNLLEAFNNGMVIQFVSRNSVRSMWWQKEAEIIENALGSINPVKYYPILLDEINDLQLPTHLKQRPLFQALDPSQDDRCIAKIRYVMGFSTETFE